MPRKSKTELSEDKKEAICDNINRELSDDELRFTLNLPIELIRILYPDVRTSKDCTPILLAQAKTYQATGFRHDLANFMIKHDLTNAILAEKKIDIYDAARSYLAKCRIEAIKFEAAIKAIKASGSRDNDEPEKN